MKKLLTRYFLKERIPQVQKNNRGQAMVEFALTLILLLVVILGLLEVGRLLFVYAAVVTSAREAARYASVSGRNDSGDLFFQDCSGIRNAAIRVTFFQNLQDDDVLIYYNVDGNIDSDGNPIYTEYCVPGDAVDSSITLDTNDRVRVDVNTTFNTIVQIVPLDDEIQINSSSSRSVLGILELE